MISKNNSDGEYLYFFQNISSSQTSFELKNLRHFSSYQIFVRACREDSYEPANAEKADDACGPDTTISIVTLKKGENDKIPFFDATMIPSNGSLGSIKVKWDAPPNPNGKLIHKMKCSKSINQHFLE